MLCIVWKLWIGISHAMDKILENGKVVAIRVRRAPRGVAPVTAPTDALQLLTINRKKGEIVNPHRHLPHRRVTNLLQECLMVVRGRIRVVLYDGAGRVFQRVVVRGGEALILLGVAHAVHFLEDSLVYETKNGPFVEDKEYL